MSEFDETINDSAFDDSGAIQQVENAPLGTMDFDAGGGGEFAPAEVGRSVNYGSLLVVVVVILSAGTLFGMRLLAGALAGEMSTSTDVEQTIDGWLERNDGTATQVVLEHETQVLEVLGDSGPPPVPLENVQTNPFLIYGEMEVDPPEIDPVDPRSRAEEIFRRERQERRAVMESAAKKLRLTTVIMGSPRLASINDRILREGERIVTDIDKVEFVVESIEIDVVALRAVDEAYKLDAKVKLRVDREIQVSWKEEAGE